MGVFPKKGIPRASTNERTNATNSTFLFDGIILGNNSLINFPKSKNIYNVVPHENLIERINFPMILVKYHGGK